MDFNTIPKRFFRYWIISPVVRNLYNKLIFAMFALCSASKDLFSAGVFSSVLNFKINLFLIMDNTYTNIYSFNVLRQDSWAAKSRLTRSAFAGVAGCIFWQLTFSTSGSGKPKARNVENSIFFIRKRGSYRESGFCWSGKWALVQFSPPPYQLK